MLHKISTENSWIFNNNFFILFLQIKKTIIKNFDKVFANVDKSVSNVYKFLCSSFQIAYNVTTLTSATRPLLKLRVTE